MSHALPILFIVVVVCGSLGILADAAVIYGIFRFKRLKTVPNVFLANWALADLFSIVCIPMNLVVYVLLFSDMSYIYICLSVNLTVLFHLAVVCFGILMSIDWLMGNYYPRASEKFRKRYLLIITIIWAVLFLLFLLSTSLCMASAHWYSLFILFAIFYVVNFVLVVTLQCSRIIQRIKRGSVSHPIMLSGRLTVITIITCSYLVAIVNMGLVYYDEYKHSYSYVVKYSCSLVSALAILGSSVLTLGVLCWLDKDFRLCLFPIGNGTHERFEDEVSEGEDRESSSNANHYTNHMFTNSNQTVAA